MLEADLEVLGEYVTRLGFEEDRRFHYLELPEVSKEIVERMKGGLIEDFILMPARGSCRFDYALYIKG